MTQRYKTLVLLTLKAQEGPSSNIYESFTINLFSLQNQKFNNLSNIFQKVLQYFSLIGPLSTTKHEVHSRHYTFHSFVRQYML